jgi:hypothetical protein
MAHFLLLLHCSYNFTSPPTTIIVVVVSWGVCVCAFAIHTSGMKSDRTFGGNHLGLVDSLVIYPPLAFCKGSDCVRVR